MKFICSVHGEVEPVATTYSCPAQGKCPICEKWLEDSEGGINIIEDEKQCILLRPNFYKRSYPEIYKKYFPEKSK